jgi:hypothetical protein
MVLRDSLLKDSQALDEIAAVARGDRMACCGPTGKEVGRRPTVSERLRAIEIILRKCLPDLVASEVSAEVKATL